MMLLRWLVLSFSVVGGACSQIAVRADFRAQIAVRAVTDV
jgi:hypothetical protein